MIIKECYIKGYGNICDKHIVFDNINEYLENNGYGKSTLTSFIVAMLYGLDTVKSNTRDFLDRKHYYPFNNTIFGGSLTLSDLKDTYIIERTFSQNSSKDDTLKVYKNNNIVNILNPGEELFNLDKESFMKLSIINSKDINTTSTPNINASLSNISFNTNNILDSIKKLEEKRKIYSSKGKNSLLVSAISRRDDLLDQINNVKIVNDNLNTKYIRLNEIENDLIKYNKDLSDINIISNLKVYDDNISAINGEIVKLKSNFAVIPELNIVDDMTLLNNQKNILVNEFNNISLSKEDKDYYDYLEDKFKEGIPTNEDITRILSKTNDNFIINSNIDTKKYELARIKGNIDNLSNIAEDILSVRKMTKSKEKLTEIPKNRANYHIIDILCEITLAIIFYFTTSPLVFLIALISALLSVGLSSYLLINGNIKYKNAVNKHNSIKEKNIRIDNTINNVLSKYSCESTEELGVLYSKYLSYKEKHEIVKDELLKFENDYNNNKIDINKFYNKYKVFNQDMFKLKKEIDDYQVFTKKLSENKNSRFNLDEDIKKINNRIVDFYKAYSINNELSLTDIRDIIVNLNNNISNYNVMVENKKKYIVNNNIYNVDYDLINNKDNILNNVKILDEEKSKLKLLISEDELYISKLDDLEYELNEVLDNIDNYKYQYYLFSNTIDELTKAYNNILDKYIKPVKDNINKYIDNINLDISINLDNNFNLSYNKSGMIRDTRHLSNGEFVIIAFIYLLAIHDSFNNKLGFIILDDPFVNLDENNINKIKEVINNLINYKQVIYLTCHKSRSIK